MAKNRVQWVTGAGQFTKANQLKAIDKDGKPAFDVVNCICRERTLRKLE